MTRPDPARTADVLAYLMDAVDELRHAREEERVNATETARFLGLSAHYFHGMRPIRYPGFRGDIPHPLSAWRDFIARTDRERQAEWDALSLPERERLSA